MRWSYIFVRYRLLLSLFFFGPKFLQLFAFHYTYKTSFAYFSWRCIFWQKSLIILETCLVQYITKKNEGFSSTLQKSICLSILEIPWGINLFADWSPFRLLRNFSKMDRKALAKLSNSFQICQNCTKVICSYSTVIIFSALLGTKSEIFCLNFYNAHLYYSNFGKD